jgi:hypothetical protein
VLRRAEAGVLDAVVALLIAHGEERARKLEARRGGSPRATGGVVGVGRFLVSRQHRPSAADPDRAKAHWILTVVTPRPEAITGMRATRARQLGHTPPEELPPPDWQGILSRLLGDPEAELPWRP